MLWRWWLRCGNGNLARTGRAPGRAARRLAAAALALACWLVAGAAPAGAHAVVVRTEPAGGAALLQGPARVLIQFNEPVAAEFSPVAVYDARGARVDRGTGRVHPADPALLTADLPDLAGGFYTVTYRVTSVDGHVIQGAFGFTVGAPAGAAATPPVLPAAQPDLPPQVGVLHGVAQAAAAGLAGVVAFLVLVWVPIARGAGMSPGTGVTAGARTVSRLAWLLLGVLAVTGVMEVGVHTGRASGLELTPSLLVDGLIRTRVGRSWMVRMACGVLAAALAGRGAGARTPPAATPWFWGAAGAGAALLLAVSLQSHAAAAGGWLPVAADWVHLVAAGGWAGGLIGLLAVRLGPMAALAPPERSELLRRTVRRFSRTATVAVLLLAVTGVYSALLHVPSLAALTGTAYGRALLIKLAILLPLLALGGTNLLLQGRGPFHRLVAGELVLALGIFVAAGFLSSLPPASAAVVDQPAAFEAAQEAQGVQVTLRVEPGRVGMNQAFISLREAGGAPVAGAGVTLRVTMTDHNMGVQQVDAVETGNGQYRVDQVVLGMAGNWQLEAVALTPAGREVRTAFVVKAAAPAAP